MTQKQTDTELYSSLQNGNSQALELLYNRYGSLVYTLALTMLKDCQEAEDLTQEVFLLLWNRQAYNPQRGSLSSYLTTVTRSRAIDRLRSRSAKYRLLNRCGQTMHPSISHNNPFEKASIEERREQVKQSLHQLPENHRRVLELAYYQGLSQTEISQKLGKPLGTIKTWARKGLLQLRDNLQELDFLEKPNNK